MAKEVAGLIKLQIKGKAANPSPCRTWALGSKVSISWSFCKHNARTQDKEEKILPDYHLLRRQVFRFCNQDSSRGYPVVGSDEAKEGSAGASNCKKVAEITLGTGLVRLLRTKMVDLNCFTVEAAMKMVAGTARSMGIAVKGRVPGY